MYIRNSHSSGAAARFASGGSELMVGVDGLPVGVTIIAMIAYAIATCDPSRQRPKRPRSADRRLYDSGPQRGMADANRGQLLRQLPVLDDIA